MEKLISIECDLDAMSVGAVRPFFERLAEDPSDVVLDLRAVGRMDGSGLGALMHVFKRKTASGAKLWVVNVGGQPRDMLNSLKVLPLLERTNGAVEHGYHDRLVDPATKLAAAE